jgi:predicted transcriptional regulator
MRANPRKARARQEEQTEATILSMLLDSHPVSRTMPELIRVLEKDRDEVNRALCALADYGLVEFEGGASETLRPSSAARRCVLLLAVAHSPLSAQRAK